MAGSINHVKREDGSWADANRFYDMIENLGDAYEMYEEFTVLVDKLKQQNEKLKKCVVWYYENEIVSLDKYIETSNCGQFKYATNLKASEILKEIEESK